MSNEATANVSPIRAPKPLHWRKLSQRERRDLAVKRAVADFQGAMIEQIEELQRQHNRLVIEYQALQRVTMRHLHRHSEILVPGEPAIVGIHPSELLKAAQEICAELIEKEKIAEAAEQAATRPHVFMASPGNPEAESVCACGQTSAQQLTASTPCPLVEASTAQEQP